MAILRNAERVEFGHPSRALVVRTKETSSNVPRAGKFSLEEELKYQDGVLSVRLRLNAIKSITEEEKDQILEIIGHRRFEMYAKWLGDCKKSGLFEKGLETLEIPSKCPKLTTFDQPNFTADEVQDITKAPNILKQLIDISYLFYKTTLLGESVASVDPAKPTPIQVKLSKEAEQLTYRVKMMQRNQFVLLGLLSLTLVVLLFQSGPKRA